VPSTRRRGTWRSFALLALAGASLLVRCDRLPPDHLSPGHPSSGGAGGRLEARVLEITDGDTIVVELAGGAIESVRYIGVNTPESTPNQPLECFGHAAAGANAELVEGRSVNLEVGAERRDAYGRLLAYVFVPGAGRSGGALFVNAELVRRGFARTLTIAPNDDRAPLFGRLEAAAGRRGLGLWGACNT